jgi:N-acetylmuramoyl-L-alanine amidase
MQKEKSNFSMNKIKFIVSSFLFFIGTALAIEFDLNIIYPAEGDTIDAAAIDSNYIFGRVLPPQTLLRINGKKTPVFKDGAFLDFLPLEHGRFTYQLQAVLGSDTLTVDRTVYNSPPPQPIRSDSSFIDVSSTKPSSDLELLPGNVIDLEFRGSPGGSGWCFIQGIDVKIPMRAVGRESRMYWGEAVFGRGEMLPSLADSCLYRGSYILQQGDSCRNSKVRFFLTYQNSDTTYSTAKGRISIWPNVLPRIAETALDITVLRAGPRKSYYYFLPAGVKLRLNAKVGNSYRVQLAKNHHAWVEDYKLRLLPDGTAMPRRYVQFVRTETQEKSTRLRVYTGERLPFRIQQNTLPQSLTVYFYGITADTDWIRYDFDNTLIREIQWQQESDDVYVLTIDLNQKNQWGFDANYDEDDNFVLDIKKTPKVGKRRRTALRRIKILLDPGHHPDTGFVGPTGFEEREANLLLSAELADKLRKKGADVVFTRQEAGVSLGERMRFAMQADADILLSLHHNAVPAGVNPFKSRGSSTYYYHPQSCELAKRIQGELLKELELNDFGLYWDNLAMCRTTQMPAVLIEPAFMLHPEEERLIRSQEYRERCTDAIVRALQNFILEFGNN